MANPFIESPDSTQPTYIYVGAFVDELWRSGLHHVVICPGSRSTPLAMTFAAQSEIHTWMHIDERSAAFFALGLAKRLQEPVALVCTSGTAAANFLPAIVEARLTHIPLLVLTADRPPELRDCGAPQAIDQNRLYGTHVKWFVEAALPEASNETLRYIRTLAARATLLTQAAPAGPVHLNMPFREPLTPDPLPDQRLPVSDQREQAAWRGRSGKAPYVTIQNIQANSLAPGAVAQLAQRLSAESAGLLIAGPETPAALLEPLLALAQRLGYPILADPLSQLRNSGYESAHILASYDAFLRLEHFTSQHAPRLVLRFGAMPTAKPLLLYLNSYPECEQIVVDEHGDWKEPTQRASEMLHVDPVHLCADLLNVLPIATVRSDWLQSWQYFERVTQQMLSQTLQGFAPLFEGRVFSELSTLLPAHTTLYVGNSMPIRDLDTFFWQSEQNIQIMGNRGANGIDGIVSSALGASAARQGPTVLVIGDLSFFHDLNGLLAARLHQLDLTIILINNDGGGIFSFLPQAAHPEHFEQLFGTPTGLDFRLAVQMYGGSFTRIADWEEYRTAVQRGISEGGLHVVEIPTERESNVRMHRQLWQALNQALKEGQL